MDTSKKDFDADLVMALNEAIQTVPIPSVRVRELPTELNQFHAAAKLNRSRLDFDSEPADFARALAHAAKEHGR
ncbi:MAG: hypothetical protein ACKVQT_21105 [Burkholderiales bacterium]